MSNANPAASPFTPEQAVAAVRDLLTQLGTEGDAVLSVLMEGRKVAGPYVFLPARELGQAAPHGLRFSLQGGRIGGFGLGSMESRGGKSTPYWWQLEPAAYLPEEPPTVATTRGSAFTEEEAREAIDGALRGLGWTCMAQPVERRVVAGVCETCNGSGSMPGFLWRGRPVPCGTCSPAEREAFDRRRFANPLAGMRW